MKSQVQFKEKIERGVFLAFGYGDQIVLQEKIDILVGQIDSNNKVVDIIKVPYSGSEPTVAPEEKSNNLYLVTKIGKNCQLSKVVLNTLKGNIIRQDSPNEEVVCRKGLVHWLHTYQSTLLDTLITETGGPGEEKVFLINKNTGEYKEIFSYTGVGPVNWVGN